MLFSFKLVDCNYHDVNRCSVFGCFTKCEGHEAGAVFRFKFVKDVGWKQQWFRLCKRKNLNTQGSIFIWKKHFEKRFIFFHLYIYQAGHYGTLD